MPTLFCPTREQVLQAILKLLPRGPAWQTRDGGPMPGRPPGFDPCGYSPEGFQVEGRKTSVIWDFWNSVTETFFFVHQRLCALYLEFWCATMSETRPEWLVEYGLPNDCDPFPDICIKVAAIGGTNCDYYALVAARSGWSITCTEVLDECGSRAGCEAFAGDMMPGATHGGYLLIVVDLAQSPAYVSEGSLPGLAGSFMAGEYLVCPPDLGALDCILSRIVHAELLIIYEVIE